MIKWSLIALSAVLIAVNDRGGGPLARRRVGRGRPAIERGAVLLTETEAEQFNLDRLTIPRIRLISAGIGRDGIPSLVDPPVVTADAAEALAGDDRVVGVQINGQARAYPIAILNWHECINDTLGGIPIAVVFCPLCDSVTVFDRRPPGRDAPLEFGIAGLLLNSNLVIYDRTDDALWSQVKMEALSGPHAGKGLRHLERMGTVNLLGVAGRASRRHGGQRRTGFGIRLSRATSARLFRQRQIAVPRCVGGRPFAREGAGHRSPTGSASKSLARGLDPPAAPGAGYSRMGGWHRGVRRIRRRRDQSGASPERCRRRAHPLVCLGRVSPGYDGGRVANLFDHQHLPLSGTQEVTQLY